MTAPNLAETHEQFPDGFPARLDDALLGHWPTPGGIVVVEHHPHGYEVHFGPCYDFQGCEACAPDRGPSNPHTSDGHHFRACRNTHGPIATVAGGEVGFRAVLQYLANEGSPPHVAQFADLLAADAAAEEARLEAERAESEALEAELEKYAPTLEERFAALESEYAALREIISQQPPPGEERST
jgi:hypothetical protein